MKQSLRYIYTFYALMLFSILLIPALFLYVFAKICVPYKHQIRWIYNINYVVILIWSPLVGIRYKCVGKQNVIRNKPCVVIYNHLNLLDVFAINRHYSIPAKPLVKKELLSIPLIGWLFRMSSIPIDRASKESKLKGLKTMESELSKGISILIFPEGTRNRTKNPLTEFKNGAFKLSVDCNVNIQPSVIMNTRNLAHPNKLLFQPGKIIIHYLPPINPLDFDFDMELIKQHCYTVMEQTILNFDKSYGTNLS